jgi:hypothetical protein
VVRGLVAARPVTPSKLREWLYRAETLGVMDEGDRNGLQVSVDV